MFRNGKIVAALFGVFLPLVRRADAGIDGRKEILSKNKQKNYILTFHKINIAGNFFNIELLQRHLSNFSLIVFYLQ